MGHRVWRLCRRAGRRAGRRGGASAAPAAGGSFWSRELPVPAAAASPEPPAAAGEWGPPPLPPPLLPAGERDEEGGIAVRREPDPRYDKPPYPQRVVYNKAELPWPYVETPKSLQIVEPGNRDEKPMFWRPDKMHLSPEEEVEQEGVQTNFHWEEDPNPVPCLPEASPYGSKTVSYNEAYEFLDGHKTVERSAREYHHKGSGAWRSRAAKEVTLRTRERVVGPGTAAYMEMPMYSNALHYGLGVVEAQHFNPYAWIGHHDNSWAWYEDGRIGNRDCYELATVFKTYDDCSMLLYQPTAEEARQHPEMWADPDRPDAKLLFFRNNVPAGDVLTLPYNDDGWFFAVTMISPHGALARAGIRPQPQNAMRALEQLSRILYPDDEDFTGDEEWRWHKETWQPYCPNRRNPYHVCSSACREVQPHMLVSNDENGKPLLVTPAFRPSWHYYHTGSAGGRPQDKAPMSHGNWKFAFGIDGNKVWRRKMPKPDRHCGPGRQKWANHNIGAMSGV